MSYLILQHVIRAKVRKGMQLEESFAKGQKERIRIRIELEGKLIHKAFIEDLIILRDQDLIKGRKDELLLKAFLCTTSS